MRALATWASGRDQEGILTRRCGLAQEGVWKTYQAAADFKPVTVPVRDPKEVKFPKIEDVVVPKK